MAGIAMGLKWHVCAEEEDRADSESNESARFDNKADAPFQSPPLGGMPFGLLGGAAPRRTLCVRYAVVASS